MFKAKQIFSKRNSWALYLYLTRLEFFKIIRHPGFIILAIVTISFLNSNFIGNVIGSAIYPTTGFFINQIPKSEFPIIFITLFFSGELVWREKNVNASSIIDTYPVSDLVIFSSKISTLFLIQFFYAILIVLFGIINQMVILNYSDINLALYIRSVFGIHLLNYWAIAVIFFLIQVISPNKYMGFLFSGLGLIIVLLLPSFGISNNLFRYGVKPDYRYSEMSGFGPFALPLIYFTVYWSFLASILFLISFKLWPRGYEVKRKNQFNKLIKNSSFTFKTVISILLIMFIITGIKIASKQAKSTINFTEKAQADYEVNYKKFENVEIPEITEISIKADLYPGEKSIDVQGNYIITNKNFSPIDTLMIRFNPGKYYTLSSNRKFQKLQSDKENGIHIFTLEKPLAFEDSAIISFGYEIKSAGFSDDNPNIDVIDNGLLISNIGQNNGKYFPQIGYDRYIEIQDSAVRNEYGLGRIEKYSLTNHKLVSNTDWVKYKAVISTSPGQEAITNGTLINSWVSNERKYFQYQTDTLINNEIAITSGKYSQFIKENNGIIYKIFYSPNYSYNITEMFQGALAGLQYCENNVGKYPYKTFTIVEIPNYHRNFGNAFSIPTLILWNEDGGFFNVPNDTNKINRVFSTSAHEASHQWWAHAVKPASYIPGGIVLNETLAQYVRLMTLYKHFPSEAVKSFLQNEMEQYFYERSISNDGENPLSQASQSFVAYNKGSLVMNSIMKLLGDDKLNTALSNYYNKFAYQDSLFSTTKDLETYIRSVTPDTLKNYFDELFNKVILFDSKVISASVSKIGNTYNVNFTIDILKFAVDNLGNETEINFNGYLPVAVYDKEGNILKSEFYKFDGKEIKGSFMLDKLPETLVVDPGFIYLDKDLGNNRFEFNNSDMTKS